jgi:hypothetical protein
MISLANSLSGFVHPVIARSNTQAQPRMWMFCRLTCKTLGRYFLNRRLERDLPLFYFESHWHPFQLGCLNTHLPSHPMN